jgi:hypothetical protein
MPPHVTSRWLSHLPSAFLAVLCGVGISGCASSYKVEVNSIINPEMPTPMSYTLTTRDPNLPQKDVGYYAVADRVRTALAAKGMYEAPRPQDADIVVEIDYGEHAPQTKVETVRSTTMVPPDPLGRAIDPLTGRPYPDNSITIGGPNRNQIDPYNSGRMTPVTTYEERVTTVSEKYIRLTASENVPPHEQARRRPAQVWIVEAIIEDEDSDVHDCMPALVAALTDYIGVSTAGKQTVTITTDEP